MSHEPELKSNLVAWIDIPVRDIDRAIYFYSQVLNISITKAEAKPGIFIGILPHDDHHVGGCLAVCENAEPSMHGTLVYYNVSDRMLEAEQRVVECGGKVLEARHAIGPHGFRALVCDSEGNRIALHSRN